MLPPTIFLATFAAATTFMWDLCHTSPVYNMQPAFITANIGTTGRNIRNLPCISRKNNQSGVCMFAIDCLKANGTHLGTCIDRFYFGSCCHIEPVHDILDNSIDSDIIPSREPPQRIANTTSTSTTISSSSETTTKRKSTTPIPITTSGPTTTINYKLSTFQSVDGSLETTTTSKPSTSKIKPTKSSTTTTTISTSSTSKKPTFNTTTSQKVTTRRPIASTTSITRRNSTTSKPQITRKPVVTTVTTTKKPIKPTGSKKPVNISTNAATTKKPSVVAKPTKKATPKPSTSSTLTTSTSTTTVPSTTKKTVATTASTTVTTTTPPPSSVASPSSSQTTLHTNASTLPSSTSTTTAGTTQASIVTWAVVDDGNKNVSTSSSTSSPANNSTSEEWIPITTSDNWVPLPSVQPITNSSQAVTTPPPTMSSTPASSPTLVKTTTESASKPSITYIPLESTTATLNGSSTTTTTTTERVNTQQQQSSSSSASTTPVSTISTTSSSATTASTTASTDAEIRPVNMSDFTDVCGRRMYPEARIVGGEKSTFGKWPWQISLRQWRTSTYLHKCGAALLNENWAITAAHCVDNVPPSDLLLRLGEHDLSTESEPYLHQERRVQIVASHPNFDPRTFEYDLALLRFYEPVTFQPNILPVCVPQTDENFVGRTAYVTGWGRLYEDGPLPSVLQEVSVPVINNSVCESMYRLAGYIEHIPHIFICAGWRRGGFDSCEGDSGGPMVIQREDKRFLLAGVISWGIGCAEPNQPGVYTRISEFRDWINQILQF